MVICTPCVIRRRASSLDDVNPKRYIGLRMPSTLGAVGDPDPGEHPGKWFALRADQDELPPLFTLGQPVPEMKNVENQEFGRFIYVQDHDGSLRPLEMQCTASPHDLHDAFGRHEWGYGGHGPGCSAFSIALDATERPREEILEELLNLAPLEEFLSELHREQEWMLLASDVRLLFPDAE